MAHSVCIIIQEFFAGQSWGAGQRLGIGDRPNVNLRHIQRIYLSLLYLYSSTCHQLFGFSASNTWPGVYGPVADPGVGGVYKQAVS